jgi:hypothetical protein
MVKSPLRRSDARPGQLAHDFAHVDAVQAVLTGDSGDKLLVYSGFRRTENGHA